MKDVSLVLRLHVPVWCRVTSSYRRVSMLAQRNGAHAVQSLFAVVRQELLNLCLVKGRR